MYRYYYHTNDKDEQLAYSHYSDPAFNKEAVIFGSKNEVQDWVYADRLQEWDRDKSDSAWKRAVAQCGKTRSARCIEVYLQNYFDDPTLELLCVLSGTRPFDGYPWYAYGYKSAESTEII
jgi:hypothetical protein